MSSLVVSVIVAFYAFNMGDAKLIFVGIEQCEVPPNKMQEGFKISLELDNKALTVDGVLNTPFPIDDNIEIEVGFEKLVNGKYEPEDFNLNGSLCGLTYGYLPSVVDMLAKALKLKELCPLPAGEYKLEKFFIEADKVELPEIEAGEQFIIKVVYKKDDVPIVCYKYELKSV